MSNENERKDPMVHGTQQGGFNRDESRAFSRSEETHGGPVPLRGDVSSPSFSGDTRGEPSMRETQRTGEINRETANPNNPETEQPRKKQRRGFAAMDPSKQKEIASKGGKASHEQGTGHEWDSSAAREAGRKGGQASRGGRGKVRTPDSGSGGSTPTGGTF